MNLTSRYVILLWSVLFATGLAVVSSCTSSESVSVNESPEQGQSDTTTAAVEANPGRAGEVVTEPPNTAIFERIGGLPDLDVRDIAQDEHGFMWFGIRSPGLGGAVRYDGYEMKVYQSENDDDRTLINNSTWLVAVDNDGTLWVSSTRGGLHRYDADTDDFTRFLHDPEDPSSLPVNSAMSMLHAEDGTLWFGTPAGLVRFNPDNGTFIPITTGGLDEIDVRAIFEEPETGRLWLGTRRSGLTIYDPDTGRTTTHVHDPDDETTVSNNTVDSIVVDASGGFWLGTRDGLNRYNPETDNFTRYYHDPDDPTTIGDSWIWELLVDSHGRFWVGHNSGLDLFNPETGAAAAHYVNEPEVGTSLAPGPIRSLFEDTSGAIWIGTLTGGLSRLSALPPTTVVYRHAESRPESIAADEVLKLSPGSDGLWLSTTAGVDFFDGTTFSHFPSAADRINGWPDEVDSLLPDENGNLWLTAAGGLVFYYDQAEGTIEQFQAPPELSSGAELVLGDVSPDGRVWLSMSGFGLIGLDDGEFTVFAGDTIDTDDPIEQSYLYLSDVVYDGERNVVWASGLGVTRFDLNTGDIATYWYDPSMTDDVSNQILSLVLDDEGPLWMAGTLGLHEFDTDALTYTKLYSDEFPVEQLRALTMGPDGTLWTLSGHLLASFNPSTEDVQLYQTVEGLSYNLLNNYMVTGPDGRIYLASQANGLYAFDPTRFATNPFVPPVAVTAIELYGQPIEIGGDDGVLQRAIDETESLELGHDQNYLSFEFSALSYDEPDRNQYAYRLEGFDDDWHFTTSERRIATYTNLDPGNYTFRVRASNNTGVWNDEGRSLAVKISPAWWASSLAYLLYILEW